MNYKATDTQIDPKAKGEMEGKAYSTSQTLFVWFADPIKTIQPAKVTNVDFTKLG